MEFADWLVDAARPVVSTAIHDGHELRPEIEKRMALPSAVRLREEDPWTGKIASGIGSTVVVNRSRFEIDLNRERDEAFYAGADDAWGLDIWEGDLDPGLGERSRDLHDSFYEELGAVLDRLVEIHGGFVLYDVHSYNHRREGPTAEPAPSAENPLVNLGTGSMPDRWRGVADAFLGSMSLWEYAGAPIDARSDVKFRGRHLAAWVHDRYGKVGCALAVEFKKTFMDEWTGEVDNHLVDQLSSALADSVEPVWKAHRRCR